MTPALFLDRDGVINVDHSYVYRKEDFHFVDGIFELVAAAKHAGFLVVVVTNQAGIGRGYYNEADFHQLMDWVKEQFLARGGEIDAIYFCPYHPDYGVGAYRQDSHCRKPKPGMLLQAKNDFKIDMPDSVMVGDKLSDAQAGLAAGVGRIFHYGSDESLKTVTSIKSLSELTKVFDRSSKKTKE